MLSTNNIVWWPDTPLALGTYYLRWTISDKAGNTSTNPIGYPLTVTNIGGQRPAISVPRLRTSGAATRSGS